MGVVNCGIVSLVVTHVGRRLLLGRSSRQCAFIAITAILRILISKLLTPSGKQLVVYYKSINRDLQKRCISECRCDERLQTKTKEFTLLVTPKDKDEVNKREVSDCEG